MDIINLYTKFIECHQEISTDTRSISPGSLFFAWKGENIDGNQFCQDALDKGARYVVLDNPDYVIDDRCILVKDTLDVLTRLAAHHRKQFSIPVIAVAGSNGKTTTKELIANVLSSQKNVIASIGSLNNHVGVPKTLLRINQQTEVAVIEMGANHLGEIAHLCTVAQPTHGIVTNIGRDHIGLFGGVGAIIESNIELYQYLRNNNGHVFVDKNDEQLMRYSEGIPRICYGTGDIGEFTVSSLVTTPYISLAWKQHYIKTLLTGEYNIQNIAAAIAVGVYLGVTDESIIQGVSSCFPGNNRSEIRETNKDNLLIKDFYNANRSSMELAIDNLVRLGNDFSEKKTIAILGDMLELGEFAHDEHQAVYEYAQEKKVDTIILIGPEFMKTYHDDVISYSDVDAAIAAKESLLMSDSIILLKASHGTNFQKLFNELDL